MTLITRFRLPSALAGAAAFALIALAAPVAAQTPCSTALPGSAALASPFAGAGDTPTELNTIYVALSPELAGALAPGNERILVVDDAGFVTEGGVLHSSEDGGLQGATLMQTWMPALRANTRYTAQLARLDEGNCVDLTLGAFMTGPSD